MSGGGSGTPLMAQYREIKARHTNAILFFRMGDFYEMFYEDAEVAARALDLTLTSRNNGAAAEVPLAGIPVKAAADYIRRLVQQGYRVAICEQIEDPKVAKGIVKRAVVETITPGGSWRDDRFGLSAPADGQTPLTVELLVPGGERQVAVSRLRIEAREVAAVVPAEVPAPHTQAPEIKDVPASPPAPGEVCVVVEPVDPGEVATAVEDGAACGLVPPVVEETAEEAPTQAPEVVEEPLAPPVVSKRKRARHGDGTYRGDNPATGDVNEAWVGES